MFPLTDTNLTRVLEAMYGFEISWVMVPSRDHTFFTRTLRFSNCSGEVLHIVSGMAYSRK